tara:strand:+ start:397 stop:501 length:105 start_codon:yes stop_codon:yes gene_type:complete
MTLKYGFTAKILLFMERKKKLVLKIKRRSSYCAV